MKFFAMNCVFAQQQNVRQTLGLEIILYITRVNFYRDEPKRNEREFVALSQNFSVVLISIELRRCGGACYTWTNERTHEYIVELL